MATIVIHHHVEDVLAAEVIGGALLAAASVRLAAWPGANSAALDWNADHVVVWTPDLAACGAFLQHLQGLAARRARCNLLVHREVAAPDHVIACPQFPLFDSTTSWVSYRRALRIVLLQGAPWSERVHGVAHGLLARLLDRLPEDVPIGHAAIVVAAIAAMVLLR